MIAVIAGATGLTGTHLLKLLLADQRIDSVIAVGRRATGVQNSKLREVLIPDLAELNKHTKLLAGDVYFCCLGTTIKEAGSKDGFAKIDYTAIIDFGRIAKQNQAKAFALISASGANANSPIFYSQLKGETEDVLKKLGLTRLIIFQPALLMGERPVKRRGESFFIKAFSSIEKFLPSAIKKRLMTRVDLLARRMLSEVISGKPIDIETITATEI